MSISEKPIFSLRFCVSQALAIEKNHSLNLIFSNIPVIGMIFLGYKEFLASQDLLSAIRNEDNVKSVKLIHTKNCYKLYRAVHVLAVSLFGILAMPEILAIPGLSLYCAVLLASAAFATLRDIYKAGKIAYDIQNKNHRFVCIDKEDLLLPRMRVPRLSMLLPWVECGIKNKHTKLVSYITIY